MKKSFLLAISLIISALAYSQVFTYSGDFHSVAGAMDKMSCYCNNGGYITTQENEKIPLCFVNGETLEDGIITVTGHYETKTHTSKSPYDACPNGNMKVLIVENVKIGTVANDEAISLEKKWQGKWKTNWGGSSDIIIEFVEKNGKVTGSYNFKNGKITATATANKLKGFWFQSTNDGWFEFELSSDNKTFTGKWGYSNRKTGGGFWNGSRIVKKSISIK